ncbi:MAG TPA: hypothetical protein VMH20_01210 [Verrucomicrobiae bacterium]|nr:hypothetical protein [Verrucomicrobiae bacterium]
MNVKLLTLSIAFAFTTMSAFAGPRPTDSGESVHVVVTATPHKGDQVPAVSSSDVNVFQGKERHQVAQWIPAQGDHAALDFYILIDDTSRDVLSTQFDDIRKFIDAQPPSTKIGIAYMQNGRAAIAQDLTDNRSLAGKAIRLPLAYPGVNASPYFSLSDLVKHWPQDNARHEVLMITNGLDPYYGIGDMNDPYLDAAIADAQRAGVLVSAIYEPSVGRASRNQFFSYWGQMYLNKLTQETGGQSYYIGFFGQAPDFTPYLNDLTNRLNHQYILAFVPEPQKKSGLQPVKVKTELHNVNLTGPSQVYVPANHP